MPPSFSLRYFTASSAPWVEPGPTSVGPPCWVTQPIVSGALLGSAAPLVFAPTYSPQSETPALAVWSPDFAASFVVAALPDEPPDPLSLLLLSSPQPTATTSISTAALSASNGRNWSDLDVLPITLSCTDSLL